jgi:hypothetical protein
VLYLAFGVPVAVLAAWWWRRERRRTARLRACAQKRQLRFSRQDILDVYRRYGGLALMRVGHSRRAWNTFVGMHGNGVWAGFFDCCDVGFGADRVGIHRCVAAMELSTGIEAVCLPAEMESRESSQLRTAIDYLSFAPVPVEGACDTNPGAAHAQGNSRSHVLYVRRPSAATTGVVKRLIESVARYPKGWAWELGDNAILATCPVSRGDSDCEILSRMLDAVAEVTTELAPEKKRETNGRSDGT